ncbi:MAG: hypothetical protein ABWZ40_07535 [Caulobacterales bacterium]
MVDQPNANAAIGQPTLPASISLALRGYQEQSEGQKIAGALIECLQSISRVIDLASLDGLTLAHDYIDAVRGLDRGYADATPPRLSDAESIGIGIVLAVMRDGLVKNHIVLRPDAIAALIQAPEDEDFKNALYSLAHLCGHVEGMACLERAFPHTTLRLVHEHPHDAQRWDVILACWGEFAACWISASFVGDLTEMIENVFLKHLEMARDAAARRIAAFRAHEDRQRVIADVYAVYGALMKYGAYHLGNILGLGKTAGDFPRTMAALDGHWFEDAFHDLDLVLRLLASELGRWPDKGRFEQLADLTDTLIEANELETIAALSRWDLGGLAN